MQSADGAASDPRLGYFRALLRATVPPAPSHEAWRAAADAHVARAYLRAMRFLAEQARAGQTREAANAIATLYRTRGLSTDTSVEAGFLVHVGLATLRALEAGGASAVSSSSAPASISHPRTGFQETIPPQSVQPFAVADALISLGLTDLASLRITCLDINPRVVDALDRGRGEPRTLMLSPAIEAAARVSMSDEFRRYVETLGLAIGSPLTPTGASEDKWRSDIWLPTHAIEARTLDIVLDRTAARGRPGVVTNVLPYFDDRELRWRSPTSRRCWPRAASYCTTRRDPRSARSRRRSACRWCSHARPSSPRVRDGPPLYDSVFVHAEDSAWRHGQLQVTS